MQPLRVAIPAMFLFAASAALADPSDYCSSDRTADQVVYTIGSWGSLRQFWEKFGGCDDGDVSLELSDRVSDLLANHWDTLTALQNQVNDRSRFEKFVLFHVDPSVMPDRFPKILDNAKNHCPAANADLCQKIAAAAAAPPGQ
jgi:hypothetical protein